MGAQEKLQTLAWVGGRLEQARGCLPSTGSAASKGLSLGGGMELPPHPYASTAQAGVRELDWPPAPPPHTSAALMVL